jgi:hypothetical protein
MDSGGAYEIRTRDLFNSVDGAKAFGLGNNSLSRNEKYDV